MQIGKEQIESLLWEEENATLDFKQAQYRFEHATDIEKSELLKDILTFANAFRRNDAFILVGVKEVKGGRSEVLGVNTQLDDASLQQFVNSKTQRAVEFSYRAMELDGRPIAVIRIPVQYRPVYLKSNFGKLRKGLVYLRRGSGTAVATPEEIARMGTDRPGASAPEPLLALSLFERGTGQFLGDEMVLCSTVLRVPPKKDIPNLTGRGYVSLIPINSDYYRELAAFTRITQLMKPVSFAVMNRGGVSAHDVRLVFEVDDPEDRYVFEDSSNFPEPPERQHEIRPLIDVLSTRTKYDVSVERTSGTWRVECSFGKIQPQDTVRLADDLYAGAHRSGTLDIKGQLFADNLSRPRPATFALRIEVDERTVSLDEIKTMELERYCSTPEGREMLAEMQEDVDSR